MSLVLGRMRYQYPSAPLFQITSLGDGIVTIHPTRSSNRVVKILAPWSLSIFNDVDFSKNDIPNPMAPQDDVPMQEERSKDSPQAPPVEEDCKKYQKPVPRSLIESFCCQTKGN